MENSVLVVDDVAKNIQIVANILQPLGYNISFAQNGQGAIEVLDKNVPDLILLDIMMPGMDGYEVCEKIKQMPNHQDTPIIFLTAKVDVDSITKAFQVGGVDYISKPFNNEELVARVNNQIKLTNSLRTIQQNNKELSELNATKDKFFSIIAHDLRNPFNALFVLTDILKNRFRTMDPNDAEEMINLLYDSTKDGYELLENLLLWSRSQRNKLEFHPTDVDIKDVTLGNIKLLDTVAIGKHIKLECKIESEIVVHADQNMIDTVFRNLLTNAIKFTPENGSVSIYAEDRKDDILICVKDTGIGIDPKTLQGLFNMDGEQSTLGTANEKGTGLGLVLCKEFIEKHNGEIWVESEEGKGSCFKFTIPR